MWLDFERTERGMANALRWAAVSLLLHTGTGCATLDERDREARDYRRATFEAEFLDYRARCTQSGKRIWISARGKVGRDGIPQPGDRYYCG